MFSIVTSASSISSPPTCNSFYLGNIHFVAEVNLPIACASNLGLACTGCGVVHTERVLGRSEQPRRLRVQRKGNQIWRGELLAALREEGQNAAVPKEQSRTDRIERCGSNPRLEYDVVIIGAGIIGIATAHHLLRKTNLSVALVDAVQPCAGATGAATRDLASMRGSKMSSLRQCPANGGMRIENTVAQKIAQDCHYQSNMNFWPMAGGMEATTGI